MGGTNLGSISTISTIQQHELQHHLRTAKQAMPAISFAGRSAHWQYRRCSASERVENGREQLRFYRRISPYAYPGVPPVLQSAGQDVVTYKADAIYACLVAV